MRCDKCGCTLLSCQCDNQPEEIEVHEDRALVLVPSLTQETWSIDRPFREPGIYVQDNATTGLVCKVWDSGDPDLDLARAKLIASATRLLRFVSELIDSTKAFDTDEEINGGDAVEWLGGFRQDAIDLLVALGLREASSNE